MVYRSQRKVLNPYGTNRVTTRRKLIESARKKLSTASVPVAAKEIDWLLLEAESISPVELFSNPNVEVSESDAQVFEAFIHRRLAREPVQYILGYTDFYGLRFVVNPSVLIPRPETELVVEHALDQIATTKRPVVVDMGTGTGCIAISIKHARPDALVFGIDISSDALLVAKENADKLNSNVVWREDDIFSDSISERIRQLTRHESVDLLVSNPPYVTPREKETIEPEVWMHEPSEAIFADVTGLNAYRALAQLGLDTLSESGLLLVEIHTDAVQGVEGVFTEAGYGIIERFSDLSGKDRIVLARIRA